LLISTDFSELRKFELVGLRDETTTSERGSTSSFRSGTSAAPPSEFDLVLSNNVFGWKLNRKWALSLAGGLIGLLLLLTAYFTNQASRAENERIRQEFEHRATQRE
jgi:hypothetical protein